VAATKLPSNVRAIWDHIRGEPAKPIQDHEPDNAGIDEEPGSPGSPPGSQTSSPDIASPLIVARIGARARVKSLAEMSEWTAADFADAFLAWVAAEYPATAGATISSADIASSFFPRFQTATGAIT
jgi:hypothetical protein